MKIGLVGLGRMGSAIAQRLTEQGFEIREGFDASFSATQPRKHGTKYHADGGVTLVFWSHAVGLRMIDPSGRRGQPGESSTGPGPVRAYYFLARDEEWSGRRLTAWAPGWLPGARLKEPGRSPAPRGGSLPLA